MGAQFEECDAQASKEEADGRPLNVKDKDMQEENDEELDQGANVTKAKKKKKKKRNTANNASEECSDPAPVPELDSSMLEVGFCVEVHSLTGAVELNGQFGTCSEWNDEKGRWHVRLLNGDVKALKPENLRLPVTTADRISSDSDVLKFDAWVEETLWSSSSLVEAMSSEERMKMSDEFKGFKFTGSLRPAFVFPQMRPPESCCLPDYALDRDGTPYSEARLRGQPIPILEGSELDLMRETCRLGREVLDIASRYVRAGVTGDEIDRIVWRACAERHLYPSPLNYSGFPKSVCVSPNEVICHGIPDCRPLQEGDIVNLDVSVYYRGFHADLNETFFIGECDEDSHTLVRTAYDALRAAAAMIKPGVMYRELGAEIHATAVEGGCCVVPSFCGHGVGRLFHGPPDVPHYKKNKAVGVMKPGHVFTIEPMLNLGNNNGDKIWPDDWTAVTRDGKRSAQFEHTFLVTDSGYEMLTARRGVNRTSMPPFVAGDFQR
eukprot:TRINITY_DN14399_c0_g5_i1.p1 TRINITY_DN14399_c0_g5~~TRINITY_DN14399_c0_g5_i1.p1  ORF type:complete len:492 (+),score=53.68 TRINITY_DN14399_c0_g5_i1:62-1537(+)